MKGAGIFLMAVSTAVILVNCSSNPTMSEEANPSSIEILTAEDVQRENSAVSQADLEELVDGNIEFAFDMYEQLTEIPDNQGRNLFFSPYSISVALAMAYAGAEGETESQMHDALRFALQEPGIHQAFNHLEREMETAASQQDNVNLSVVNSLWGQYDKEFQLSFLDALARNYGAGMNLVDFENEPDVSRLRINAWVEDQTNNRIEELLPPGSISASTRLVLTNAIYFLADWLYTFDPELTTDATFHMDNGESRDVELMSLAKPDENVKVLSALTDISKAVELPYVGNRFSMIAVLPREGSFDEYENSFDREELSNIISSLDSNEIKVKLPRFTFGTSSVSLKTPLLNMGMQLAFNPSADFSGIDGNPSFLYVGDVIHKAFIAVDEQGTEAAAATAVIMETTSRGSDPNFIADEPFIYFIRDRQTGAVLFMGRVMDPTDEGE